MVIKLSNKVTGKDISTFSPNLKKEMYFNTKPQYQNLQGCYKIAKHQEWL